MLYTSRVGSLPSEVLKQVFQNLAEKEDLKTCLLVCKSWNLVAQEYFDSNLSIKIKYTAYEVLMEDIPIIGENVKAIKLKPYKVLPTDEHNEMIWRTILGYCPHITSIYFLKSRSILSLLEALQGPDLMLNDLQKIEVRELESYPLETQDLYLQANAHYHKTITSLRLYALMAVPRTIRSDGLVKFISQFSRLTCLKVNSPFSWEAIGIDRRRYPEFIIDIKQLFQEAPQLKEVKLYDCDIVARNWRDTNTVQIMEHIYLINLKIKTSTITTSTFQYVVALLKQVKYLHLIIHEIITDETVSGKEFLTVLNDLKACTSEMETANLKYNYNGQGFCAFEDDFNENDYVTDSCYSDDKEDSDHDCQVIVKFTKRKDEPEYVFGTVFYQ
ncbi:hypothetical protein INT48_001441 [Thamnidium elegans]|uniref:F-box domain-containing protein n=1 Tax=Thamnidium elegans TaxID=101142 RepID=A0A8H7SPG9_9FUNG|nr:hypothetical protein INT48_001441 [Thamnidium elegans]